MQRPYSGKLAEELQPAVRVKTRIGSRPVELEMSYTREHSGRLIEKMCHVRCFCCQLAIGHTTIETSAFRTWIHPECKPEF